MVMVKKNKEKEEEEEEKTRCHERISRAFQYVSDNDSSRLQVLVT